VKIRSGQSGKISYSQIGSSESEPLLMSLLASVMTTSANVRLEAS